MSKADSKVRFDSDKKTPTGFPIDKNGVPRNHYGDNVLSTGRKSKTRK